MSSDLANELHRLYTAYYANRLQLADYRYQRAMLLDSLAAADEPIEPIDPMKTMPRLRMVGEEKIEEPPPAAVSPEPVGSRIRWPHVLVICVVIFAGVIVVVMRQLDTGQDPRRPVPVIEQRASSPVEAPPAPQPALESPLESEPRQPELARVPDVGQPLVEAFLASNDWREMSLLEFQDSWSRIPAPDRIVAKGAVWFAPIVAGLEYRISETKEFSSGPESEERLEQLYALSLSLGLVELVPAGWKPRPEDINGGAERVADSAPVAEPVAAPQAPPAQVAERETPAPAPVVEEARPSTTVVNENACRAEQLQTRRRNCVDVIPSGQSGPPMRVLEGGTFVFGEDSSRTIAKPFAISLFEITRGEFTLYCEESGSACPPEAWPGDDMPVVNIDWYQASAYCEWLSEKTGYVYRLPTTEEWEYAARAGSETAYPYGDELLPAQARYSSIDVYDSPLPTSDKTTQRNGFGLWHVVGNVQEWVADDGKDDKVGSQAGPVKIVRGGSYASSSEELRTSAQFSMPATSKDSRTGFRVVREL
jgi:formylglycine-generating enzyme required for sulfatase activity